MFARAALRNLCRPAPGHSARYSTAPPTGGSTAASRAPLIIGTIVVSTAATYYYYFTEIKKPQAEAKAKRDVPPVFTNEAGWVGLKVQDVREVSPTTKMVRFELPDGAQSGLKVASALLAKYQEEGSKPVIRPYTPVSSNSAEGYLDLLVKKYKGGPMSSHIHQLKPGDTLDLKGPIPKFPYTPNTHNVITMIAGGTGITPMFQVIKAIFEDPADTTSVNLVYGNVNEGEILLKPDLDELVNKYPRRMKVTYLLDQAPRDAGWATKGFVTKEILKQVLPEPNAKGNNKIFVCGPPGLYKAVSGGKKSPKDQGELTGILAELGYKAEDVYKF